MTREDLCDAAADIGRAVIAHEAAYEKLLLGVKKFIRSPSPDGVAKLRPLVHSVEECAIARAICMKEFALIQAEISRKDAAPPAYSDRGNT